MSRTDKNSHDNSSSQNTNNDTPNTSTSTNPYNDSQGGPPRKRLTEKSSSIGKTGWDVLLLILRWIFLNPIIGKYPYATIVIVIPIAFSAGVFGEWRYELFSKLLPGISASPNVSKDICVPAPANFATMKGVWTDFKTPFNPFADVQWEGHSVILLEEHQMPARPSGNKFMRINYTLNKGGGSLRDSYVGVYSEWTRPPGKNVSLDRYKAIAITANFYVDQAVDGLRVMVSLASENVHDYGYHEYNFLPDLLSKGGGIANTFAEVEIPFSKLGPPDYITGEFPPFESSHVFRVTMTLKYKGNQKITGSFDVAEIRFVK